jgi:ABC-type iron transport system FetAB ATPase subunit
MSINVLSLYSHWLSIFEKSSSEVSPSNWVSIILLPVIKCYADRKGYSFAITGPSGLGSRVFVSFVDIESGDKKVSIAFEPNLFPEKDIDSPLCIVDFRLKNNDYLSNSIGELNGFNYPILNVPKEVTLAELDLHAIALGKEV